jgi:osmotically inducible protein OsmC
VDLGAVPRDDRSVAKTQEVDMIRKSTAVWRGDGLHGNGALATQSGVFRDQPYSFKTRFQSEDGKAGTNPEELLGAAHAGCYAMALSFALTEAGHVPADLRVTAAVDLSKVDDGFAIRSIALELEARVPGIDAEKFRALAEKAKKDCPVSKALAATPITLSAKLV